MEEIKKLKMKRKIIRTTITIACQSADQEVQSITPSEIAMTVMKGKLTQLQNELSELDEKIIDMVEEAKFEEEFSRAAEYRFKTNEIVLALEFKVQKCATVINNRESDNSSVSTRSREMAVKLPQLKIASFSGDPLKWKEFWDGFDSVVNSNDSLTKVVKFNYLISFLNGDAKTAIEGIAVTNDNYPEALEILRDRFGNEETVIFAHLDKLFSMPGSTNEISNLRGTYDQCEKHIRCLKVFGALTLDQIFAPLILSKLPRELRVELHRKNGRQKWDLTQLRQSVRDEIEAREMGERLFGEKTSKIKPLGCHKVKTTTEAFLAHNTTKNVKCPFCSGEHYADECTIYSDLDSRKVKLEGRCFKCLRSGHLAEKCYLGRICAHCKRRGHHRSLCPRKFGAQGKQTQQKEFTVKEESTTVTMKAVVDCDKNHYDTRTVLGQTAVANVANPELSTENVLPIGMFLDTGSHRSYITEDVTRKLKLKPCYYVNLSIAIFLASSTKKLRCPVVEILVLGKDGSKKKIYADVVPRISCPVERVDIDFSKYRVLQGLSLAQPIVSNSSVSTIDLLIGNNFYYDFVKLSRKQLGPGLVALDTVFGWIPTGRIPSTNTKNEAHVLLTSSIEHEYTDAKFSLEKFWSMDLVGVRESPNVCDDDLALENFNKTICFKDDRYEVTWPWREERPDLPNNYSLAFGRLKSLVKRLEKSPELMKKYDKIIKDQLRLGIIEEVPVQFKTSSPLHYMPHHCVLKPDKATTKLRIVYDASAKSSKNVNSLNDCLFRGPVIMEDLTGILLRFRLNKIGISCDIEKAFLQIGLQERDRDVTRFLWLKDSENTVATDNVLSLRFCRVPFGIISSPFLLSATVSHHLKIANTKTAMNVKRNIYVDNILIGSSNRDESVDLYFELKELLRQASMNLREWSSNDKEFISEIPEEDKAVQGEPVSILGLLWRTETDELCLREPKIDISIHPTKRYVLQKISEIFDPIGICSPITVKSKVLMQELWKRKLAWEDNLPLDLVDRWKNLEDDLKEISRVKIQRFIGAVPLKESNFEIHCFSDASQRAYATAIYLLITNNDGTYSNLIFSRTRIAPINQVSLPRLELMGVLIGVRGIEFVREQLGLKISRTILWTDSKCVLHWINSSKILPVFVENRLREIRCMTDVEFRYVPTSVNPADYPTRGMTISEVLESDTWWHGPRWLTLNEEFWPERWNNEDKLNCTVDIATVSEDSSCHAMSVQVKSPTAYLFGIYIDRFSSLNKLLRISAWILRFVTGLRGSNQQKGLNLCAAEIEEVRSRWEIHIQQLYFKTEIEALDNKKKTTLINQLGLFRDGIGNLRCGGRINNADLPYETKHPKLLPRTSHYTYLLIKSFHEQLLHSGAQHTLSQIRNVYWIPQGRARVQEVIRKCVTCRKYEGRPFKPPLAPPLPDIRITKDFPFSYTGIDHMGPLYIKAYNNGEDSQKVWICLFTCAVIRAVHLEVVTDLSADQFLLALRRFVSRRGQPKVIISDNAKCFKLSSSVLCSSRWQKMIKDPEVQSYVSNNRIKWKYIIEYAPWMGGFYERMVGSVKRSLRKTIKNRSLTLLQLQTITTEVEAVINTRPLTYVQADLEDQEVLTPAHFLLGNHRNAFMGILPSEDLDFIRGNDSVTSLLQKWKKGQRLLDQFWYSWKNEYLLSLREKSQGAKRAQYSHEKPNIGTIVLIGDCLPRGRWKMGRIIELITSEDGLHRAANVSLSTGKIIRRSLKLLYPIEYSDDVSPEKPDHSNEAISAVNVGCRKLRVAAIQASQRIRSIARRECHNE